MPHVTLSNNEGSVEVAITRNGELKVAPFDYSEAYYISVDQVSPKVFEVVEGKVGHRFVITGLLISSTKTFGSSTTAETVLIYRAKPHDLSTNSGVVLQLDMLKNDRIPATGLNLMVGENESIVATATDTSVDITVAGYYIPVI